MHTVQIQGSANQRVLRLTRAPRESFSNVVRRARWDDLPPDARSVLTDLRTLAREHPEVLLAPDVLRALERRKRTSRRTSPWER
jgi:hypothetical protein